MNYIVSEEDIENLQVEINDMDIGVVMSDWIDTLKSVELVASGEFNSGAVGNKYIADLLEDRYLFKEIKVYIQKVKE